MNTIGDTRYYLRTRSKTSKNSTLKKNIKIVTTKTKKSPKKSPKKSRNPCSY